MTNLQKIWSLNHAMPWLSSAQRTPGLIDEAHFVHIFCHSCNILGTGWITFKVFSGCGFLKRPYVIVSPRITLIQRLLKYSPLPDIPPFQIMVHGVVLDHWIYSFWGLGLLGRRDLRPFKALTVMSPWPCFFRGQAPDRPVPNEQWWVGDSGEFMPFHSGSWSLVWGAICCLWHRTARVLSCAGKKVAIASGTEMVCPASSIPSITWGSGHLGYTTPSTNVWVSGDHLCNGSRQFEPTNRHYIQHIYIYMN